MLDIELGHLGPAPRHADDLHNRLYYQPETGMVVAIECRVNGGGWRAGVIAARAGIHPAHIELSEADLTRARQTIDADADGDPDLFALLWQTRVCQRWRGGHIFQVARTMAESLRPPGSLAVEIDTDTARRLTLAAHLRPPALRVLLHRLIDAGMVARFTREATVAGTYRLTLREPPHRLATAVPVVPAGRVGPER